MKVKIFEKIEDLYESAANFYIQVIKQKPDAVLGLATGTTPIPLYQNLIKAYQKQLISFKNITTFNLDEYVGLDKSNAQSYFSFMRNELFDYIDINLDNTHILSCDINPKLAIKQFQSVLKRNYIDVQLLGLGSNGHIGFNEPGTPFTSVVHVTKLAKTTIADNSRLFDSLKDVPKKAITMGIKDIMSAKAIIVIALGSKKSQAVNLMINGPIDKKVPASILQNHPDVTVYLDQDAASLLKDY